jgi:hypothetical protein
MYTNLGSRARTDRSRRPQLEDERDRRDQLDKQERQEFYDRVSMLNEKERELQAREDRIRDRERELSDRRDRGLRSDLPSTSQGGQRPSAVAQAIIEAGKMRRDGCAAPPLPADATARLIVLSGQLRRNEITEDEFSRLSRGARS